MAELAARYGMKPRRITKPLRRAAALYGVAKQQREDMRAADEIASALALAKRFFDAWASLSGSLKIALFDELDHKPFTAGLDHLANRAPEVAATWPEAPVPGPRRLETI